MLHTVHASPFESDDLSSCLRVVGSGDELLLYENAVIAAVDGGDWCRRLGEALGGDIRIHALVADLDARGIKVSSLVDGVQPVDYDGFVDLVERNDTVQAW